MAVAAVEALRLPVPAVSGIRRIGDRWVVLDRVSEGTFAERMREDPTPVPRHLEVLGAPASPHPCAPGAQLGGLKVRLSTRRRPARALEAPRRQALLGGLADMPDGDRLCPGDFRPLNVQGDAARPVVIDWPDRAVAMPAADVCPFLAADEAPRPRISPSPISTPMVASATCRARPSSAGSRTWAARTRLAEHVPDEVE